MTTNLGNTGQRINRPGTKLKESQVLEILVAKETYSVLAKLYEVSVPLIHYIKEGKRWNRVTGLPYHDEKWHGAYSQNTEWKKARQPMRQAARAKRIQSRNTP